MDVGVWLGRLGLGQYEAAFRDNEIDDRVLPNLTAEDLKDLGIGIVGHRRRLLDAIAVLRAEASVPAPVSDAPAENGNAVKDSAERRQVTVMFADLVGSTARSTRMDPEDLREIIAAYHRCCAQEITRANGFVAKYMGDGVLAYFGYPQAHEDDAEQSVRAALAVVAAVPKLPDRQGDSLQVRIGIATGLVVIGDLVGQGDAQERGVVGETPNLAARLQTVAEAGEVIISHSTHRLIGGMFDCHDLGQLSLKGFSEVVQAWQVIGMSALQDRFEAQHTSNLVPLVGREEEIELLLRRWRQAARGDGRVVLLSGEAGIGKSRLIAELLERLASGSQTRLRYFCSPQHADSAFYPVINELERAAKLGRDDSASAKLEKLALLLGVGSERETDLQLIAELLSIPPRDSFVALQLSPQRKRERTLEALLGRLETVARQQPILITYEDVHWLDPSSRDLLDMLVERVSRLPLLLAITFRPEFQPPWIGQPNVTSVILNRLDPRDRAALVKMVARDHSLSDGIMAEIVERTDGVPLFVEELTKAMIEANDGRGIAATVSPSALAVPATLHASLMARLDRLGPRAKEIAQVGATIGRDFPYDLLACVAQKGDRELVRTLNLLEEAGLVFSRGAPPHANFQFKHALVRDAAYGTLLRGHRQELHARIARALRDHFFESVAEQPEILAYHFGAAGMIVDAVEYWIKAGELARRGSANAEAVVHFHKALELIRGLPDDRMRLESELRIQYALGQVHMATKGYASEEATSAYHRARELSQHASDREQLMPVFIGLRTANQVQGRLRVAHEYASQCLEIARQRGDRIYMAQANVGLGHTLCTMGHFVLARRHLAEAFAAYDPSDDLQHQAISGFGPQVFGLGISGCNEWFLGHPDAALNSALEAIQAARRIGYPQGIEQALNTAAHVHLLRCELDSALNLINSALIISREQGFHLRIAMLRLFRGWALSIRGDHRTALSELLGGLQDYRATGARAWQSNFLALLAHGYLRAGMISEGLSAVTEARDVIENQDEHWWSAELQRLEGDLLRMERGAGADQIERCYSGALRTAHEQQAKSWELRAATSLARLWCDQGKQDEARELLAPVYGWFTEGFDTPDLKQARDLLDDLHF